MELSMSERRFTGIWIPAELWMTNELTSQEKIMWAEIDSLDNENGCFASNAYLAEFFGLSERRVREILSALEGKGAIHITVKGPKRTIKVADKFRLRWNVPAGLGGGKSPTYNKEDNKANISMSAKASESGNKKPAKRKAGLTPPTESEVRDWARCWAEKREKPEGAVVEAALKAFEYYTRMEWRDVNGKRVQNWKLKIQSVWLTPEKLEKYRGGDDSLPDYV
jgi:hypothetical protein